MLFDKKPTAIELLVETSKVDFQTREQPVTIKGKGHISSISVWDFEGIELSVLDIRRIELHPFAKDTQGKNNKHISIRPLKDAKFHFINISGSDSLLAALKLPITTRVTIRSSQVERNLREIYFFLETADHLHELETYMGDNIKILMNDVFIKVNNDSSEIRDQMEFEVLVNPNDNKIYFHEDNNKFGFSILPENKNFLEFEIPIKVNSLEFRDRVDQPLGIETKTTVLGGELKILEPKSDKVDKIEEGTWIEFGTLRSSSIKNIVLGEKGIKLIFTGITKSLRIAPTEELLSTGERIHSRLISEIRNPSMLNISIAFGMLLLGVINLFFNLRN